MLKYKLQNGWTIESMMARIKERNTGVPARKDVTNPGTLYNKCYYRSPTRNQCLVGCFISDKEYLPEMEGKGVRHIENYLNELPLSTYALEELQILHDAFVPSKDGDFHAAVERWLRENVEA